MLKNKEEKTKMFGLVYFLSKYIYQLTFNTLELKQDKLIDCFIGWKSKGVYNIYCVPYIAQNVLDINVEKY